MVVASENNFDCCLLQILNVEQVQNKYLQLTDEGSSVVANGSHEALVFHAVPEGGILQSELMVNVYMCWCFVLCLQ